MSDLKSSRRVFILGAGFSKSVGMPDAAELTDRLLDYDIIRNLDDLQAWAKGLRRRVANVDGDSDSKISIEKFFDYAIYDIDMLDLQQQTQTCNIGHDSVPANQARKIRGWLRALETRLPAVLIAAQDSCKEKLDPIRQVATRMRSGDTVLMFNYDTLLECVLNDQNTTWSHGFPTEERGDVTVLKLHGSMDWLLVYRDDQDQCRLLYELHSGGISIDQAVRSPDYAQRKLDTVLVRSPNVITTFRKLVRQVETEHCVAPLDQPAELGIAGFGAHKQMGHLVGIGHVWREALVALCNAQEVYVIGWSASPYDAMARFYFASYVARPTDPARRIVVVDPRVEKDRTNYESVFGSKIEVIAKGVEEVDWSALLGD